jgi:hypothetical protein
MKRPFMTGMSNFHSISVSIALIFGLLVSPVLTSPEGPMVVPELFETFNNAATIPLVGSVPACDVVGSTRCRDLLASWPSTSRPYVALLLRFSDAPNVTPHAPSYYEGLLGETYPALGHYYREVSYN